MNESRATLQRWQAAFRALRCGAASPAEYERVVAAHREPHRRWHTLDRLEACLAEFDAVRSQAERPAEVELALWFLDAVYVPRRRDNEERSAAWARRVLRAAVVPESVGERVERWILATRHDGAPPAGDGALVVDIDLAVLGRDPDEFAGFETSVRAEHRWVPGFVYRRRRRRELESIARREAIYASPVFRDRYEARARENLARALGGTDAADGALGEQRRSA